MAWRFKASKYKNASLQLPKKEYVIGELPVGTLPSSFGNHIKASGRYIVFQTDLSVGGSLGYLPLETSGKQNRKDIPMIQAHGEPVTDFDFSPFDDYLLATGSDDNTIKIWLLPEEGNTDNLTVPVEVFTDEDRKFDNILWHTTADGILAASTNKTVKVFDVSQSKQVYALADHDNLVQSITWSGCGGLLATSCKDKQVRIFDPRTAQVVQKGRGCPNIKESRIVWLGNRNQLLTTGFNESRNRTAMLLDTRNLSTTLAVNSYDTSTGVLIPLYDADTGMLFLAGKGDTSIRYLEVNEKEPYLVDNSIERTEQIKGAAILPKRGVDVMKGEVNRLLILAQNSIIPTPVIVPRKSYRDFHDDLFPDTNNGEPALISQQWLNSENGTLSVMSLNPARRPKVQERRGAVFSQQTPKPSNSTNKSEPIPAVVDTQSTLNGNVSNGVNNTSKESTPDKPIITTPKPVVTAPKPSIPVKPDASFKNKEDDTTQKNESTPNEPLRKAKPFAGVRQSKFRHLKATILHRSQHIENIRKQDRTVPGESDMFHVNNVRCAVPIEGAGGLLSIIELSNTGKQPTTDVPYLQHGSKITDFVWDPFDDSRIVVCCDDARIKVWKIPEGGLTETTSEPEMSLRGHTEKIYFAKFHPMAKDLLVTASYDMKVKFWDLSEGKEIMQITEHPDQIFCCAWSPDGKLLATACKDGQIRIFDPRKSLNSIKSGNGPKGTRGARCGWALGGKYLYTSGFDIMGKRKISLYDAEDLSELSHISLDMAPSLLVSFYDEDSSVLFLTGRGERQIHTVEIAGDYPHLFQLATCQLDSLHQAMSFQSKLKCVVKDVEFARMFRLTKTTVEPVTFTVPRVKKEYFQDDLFPATKVIWEPVLTCSEWMAGQNGEQRSISLQPDGMKKLSDAPTVAPKPKKYASYNKDTFKTDEEKKEELLSAMTSKLEVDTVLEQDLMEGVDEDEWDD